jgi:hypothetical protein
MAAVDEVMGSPPPRRKRILAKPPQMWHPYWPTESVRDPSTERNVVQEALVIQALSLSAVFAAILAISVPLVHIVVNLGFRLLGY